MRILHLIDSSGVYGAERLLLSLAAAQRRLGLDPIIGSIRAPGVAGKDIDQEARRMGLEVTPVLCEGGFDPRQFLNVGPQIVRTRAELVHTHGYKANILVAALPRSKRKFGSVATLHGWTNTKLWSRMTIFEALDVRALKRLDAVVTVSEVMRAHPHLKGLSEASLRTIQNGIEIDADTATCAGQRKQQLLSSLNLPESWGDEPVVAFVGRLSEEKNPLGALYAINELNKQGRPVRLLIIGDGELRQTLVRTIRELDLGSRVHLAGFRDDARKLLAGSDVLAISSLTEGLPIVLLEALVERVPVVATGVGGIPSVLGPANAGMLVPMGEPSLLARGIESVLTMTKGAREGMIERGASLVKSKYCIDVTAREYQELYRTLMDRRTEL